MKKSSIISIVAGFVLVIASFAIFEFSGTSMVQSIQNMSEEDGYRTEEYIIPPTGITEVSVDSSNDEIKVLPNTESDMIRIEYYVSDNHTFKIEHDEYELSIEKQTVRYWQWFSFGSWGARQVVIHVPVDSNIEYSLDTSNGAISVSNINARELDAETSNGFIQLEQLNVVGKIEVKTSNASISSSDVKAHGLSAKSSNGAIKINNTTSSDWIYAQTSNAGINFDKLTSNSITFYTSNGQIQGSVVGNNSEYSKILKTSNGDLIVDDVKYDKHVEVDGGTKSLDVKTSNARIEINFTD